MVLQLRSTDKQIEAYNKSFQGMLERRIFNADIELARLKSFDLPVDLPSLGRLLSTCHMPNLSLAVLNLYTSPTASLLEGLKGLKKLTAGELRLEVSSPVSADWMSGFIEHAPITLQRLYLSFQLTKSDQLDWRRVFEAIPVSCPNLTALEFSGPSLIPRSVPALISIPLLVSGIMLSQMDSLRSLTQLRELNCEGVGTMPSVLDCCDWAERCLPNSCPWENVSIYGWKLFVMMLENTKDEAHFERVASHINHYALRIAKVPSNPRFYLDRVKKIKIRLGMSTTALIPDPQGFFASNLDRFDRDPFHLDPGNSTSLVTVQLPLFRELGTSYVDDWVKECLEAHSPRSPDELRLEAWAKVLNIDPGNEYNHGSQTVVLEKIFASKEFDIQVYLQFTGEHTLLDFVRPWALEKLLKWRPPPRAYIAQFADQWLSQLITTEEGQQILPLIRPALVF